jgi:hypothetical protein
MITVASYRPQRASVKPASLLPVLMDSEPELWFRILAAFVHANRYPLTQKRSGAVTAQLADHGKCENFCLSEWVLAIPIS